MRRVRVDDLETGMVVGRNIYSSDSRILLSAGVKLNNKYITRLKEIGIYSVYINDEIFGEIDFPEIISESTRIKAVKTVKDNFQLIEKERHLNIHQVKDLVDDLIDQITDRSEVLLSLMDVSSYDDYTFAHSLNVSIISLIIGISLMYDKSKLIELGIGALLHDIGKTKIDKKILNKREVLTQEEFQEIKKHPENGFNILRKHKEISLLSSHVAYQHHERWDGTGYPRGICGEDIHEYARIVAAADVYDALMGDRPYRPPFTVDKAVDTVKNMMGTYLDPQIANIMIANIAVYPVGTLVELSTRDIAVVVMVKKLNPTRPAVRIIYDPASNTIGPGHEIDLSKMATVRIIRTLDKNEVDRLTGIIKGRKLKEKDPGKSNIG